MKDKIISFGFISFILVFMFLYFIIPDEKVSYEERRKLASFPKISINNILDSSYMEKLDDYTLDHFPYRSTLRRIKATTNYKLFNKLENNGIYVNGDYIFKSEYQNNKQSIDSFITKIKKK